MNFTGDQEVYRRIVEAVPEGIWIVDTQGRTIFCTERMAEILGTDVESMAGGTCLDCVFPADLPEAQRHLALNMAGDRLPFDFRLRRNDGSAIWVSISCKPMYDDSGVVVGLLGLFTDITERKRAEATLRRNHDEIVHLNRVAAMGELTAALAHEINQPLAAILINAQAARKFLSYQPPNVARVHECLTDVVADDKRAGEVIGRLREMLKKGERRKSLVDLSEAVSDAVRLAGSEALLRQVGVKFEQNMPLPPVLGDRVQLCQVALNLIVNGLDAAAEQLPGNRWVLVRTAQSDGDGVELTVEDSGKGIAEGDLDRVFEPFFSTKPKGLGMGLSISRSIVQAHGGQIWAENVAGRGGIFRCSFPVGRQTAEVTKSAFA